MTKFDSRTYTIYMFIYMRPALVNRLAPNNLIQRRYTMKVCFIAVMIWPFVHMFLHQTWRSLSSTSYPHNTRYGCNFHLGPHWLLIINHWNATCGERHIDEAVNWSVHLIEKVSYIFWAYTLIARFIGPHVGPMNFVFWVIIWQWHEML